MRPILVIGDVHLKHRIAERIVERFPDHTKIFLGDYFDDFGDSAQDNIDTARWLQRSLEDPLRIHLMGNHDFHYWQWSPDNKLYCSGFTWAKFDAINSVLTTKDWDGLRYTHHEAGWWFVHAGLTLDWFAHPILGITPRGVEQIIQRDIEGVHAGIFPQAIWSADFYRGGRNRRGGCVWNDWRNLDSIPGVRQVVGHTPHDVIMCKYGEDGLVDRICADCHLNEVLLIEDQTFEIRSVAAILK